MKKLPIVLFLCLLFSQIIPVQITLQEKRI